VRVRAKETATSDEPIDTLTPESTFLVLCDRKGEQFSRISYSVKRQCIAQNEDVDRRTGRT